MTHANTDRLLRRLIAETIRSFSSSEPAGMERHLASRGVDPGRTRVIIDEEGGTATFLLYNLSGQLVGYQRYNPRGSKEHSGRKHKGRRHDPDIVAQMKYYTYVGRGGDEKTKKIAVWGLESLDDRPFVFVTEGIFDAVKAQNAGYPCIAVLANHPKPLREWFRMLGKRVIAVADRDDAGSKLRNIADLTLTVPEPYKDLGEMPQEEADLFLARVFL